MNRTQLIKWGFKMLCVIGISIILCGNIVNAQGLTDKNFKSKVSKGFVVVKFIADYQMQNLDPELLKGVVGHEDAIIIEAKSTDVKKICKKLRIRNYPSIALFFDGRNHLELVNLLQDKHILFLI
jgi:hypothetical protein